MGAWISSWLWPPAPQPQPVISPAPPGNTIYNGDFPLYDPCRQITHPTLYQLGWAAQRWQQVVDRIDPGLNYAFAGSFIARASSGEDFEVQEIELVFERSTLDNNGERLNKIYDSYPDLFGMDDRNPPHHLVLIDLPGRRGIAIRAFALGTDGYPDAFVPFPSHPLGVPGPEPTKHRLQLASIDPRLAGTIPILRIHLVLQQRLLHYHPDSPDQSQAIRELREISCVLRTIAKSRTVPQFPPGLRANLTYRVKSWIRFADNHFVPTTPEDVRTWRLLGLDITDNYLTTYRRQVAEGP